MTDFSNPFSLTTPTGLTATTSPGAYSDNMWGQLESLVEPEIQMQLARKWKTNSIWRAFNTFKISMKRPDGSIPESIKFKGVYDMEPTVAPIGLYQIWLPNNYTDTWEQTINFKHYGDKVALHKYDDMVQSYRLDNKTGMINLRKNIAWRIDHRVYGHLNPKRLLNHSLQNVCEWQDQLLPVLTAR